MFNENESSKGLFDADEAFDLIHELSAGTPDSIRRKRAYFRLSVKAGVVVQPGNASDLHKLRVRGVTGDVSEGGCSALLPVPIPVADIYRLQFDRDALDLPLIFARCVRCRLVREDAFETGFAFFTKICLPENLYAAAQMEDE